MVCGGAKAHRTSISMVVSHVALQQTGLCENLLLAGNNLPGITGFCPWQQKLNSYFDL